ncbi:MAG: SDR family oxidoreductase [Rhabdochlamydiaceae bacterium]|nr:SDR family oxidoreductase [Rhabdochlamydiaceae bacterium]
MAKVLVTGSTGFIGKRLILSLLEQGHEVYALSRIKGVEPHLPKSASFHLLYGDLKDSGSLSAFPNEIDAAYYLVHSMGDVVSNLASVEKSVAQHFLSLIEKTRCQQIIYLGGIIEKEEELSPHLQSRLLVENILKASKIPCTVLRASIIIGAGSASFEIIRDLVEKLPIMVAPRWVNSFCQPISIRDVLFYLTAVLLNPACYPKTFDIGGPDIYTFKQVLLKYAAFRKLKRVILNVPFLTPRLSSYWLVFVTSVRFSICFYLVESMRHHSRCLNTKIQSILPHQCLTFDQALELAFLKISQNEVLSTWMDSWELKGVNPDIQAFIQVPKEGCLHDVRRVPITIPVSEVKKRIWSIGGDRGWYSMNWAWWLRGLIDQLVGGTGLNRGRRHPEQIQVGDSIDFWRVLLADEENGHLILYAEMKLPGEAWLEFKIEDRKWLVQTATFRPKGIFGRLYWYCLIPLHGIIFGSMSRTIAQKLVNNR